MQFQYTEKDSMTLKEFGEANQEQLPKLLYIVEGNYGKTIYDEAATGEVIRVHCSVTQRRVLAREDVVDQASAGYLSLPLDTPYQFCVVTRRDSVLKPCSLRSIVQENSSFPIKVKLASEYKTFKVGQSVNEARRYSHLLLMQEYDETFLCCNTIQGNGEVRLEVMQLALSSDIDVAIVTGIANESTEKFREFLDKVNKDVDKVDFSTRIGNPDITRITKEGTGSGNPLPELNFNLFLANDQQLNTTDSNTTYFSADIPKFNAHLDFTPPKGISTEEQQLLNLDDNDIVRYTRVIKRKTSNSHSTSSATATNSEHISSQDVYNDTVIEDTEPHTAYDEKQISKSIIEMNVSDSGIYEQMDACALHPIEDKCIEILVPTARYARRKRDVPSGAYGIPIDSCVRVCATNDKEIKKESALFSKLNVPIASGVYKDPICTDNFALSKSTLVSMSPPLPLERPIVRSTNLESEAYEDEDTIMHEMLTKQEGYTKHLDSGIYEEASEMDSAVPYQTSLSTGKAIYEGVSEIEFKRKKNESNKPKEKGKGGTLKKSGTYDFASKLEAPENPSMTEIIKQSTTLSLTPASLYMTTCKPNQVSQQRTTKENSRAVITKTLPKAQCEQSIYEERDRPLREISLKRTKDVEVKPRLPLSSPPKRKHISDKVMSPQELDLYVSMDDLMLSDNVSGNNLKSDIPKRTDDNMSSTLLKSFDESVYMEMSDLTKCFRSENSESGSEIYEDMAVIRKWRQK